MKVAAFLNLRFYKVGDAYYAEEQYYKFWLELAESFEHLYLCVPALECGEATGFTVNLNPQKVTVVHLPFYGGSMELYAHFLRFAREARAAVASFIDQLDLFVAVVPNLLGLSLTKHAEEKGIDSAFYVRGDLPKTVRFEYSGSPTRLLPIALAHLLEWMAVRRMKKTPTFVVGKELASKYAARGGKTIPIITSLIRNADITTGRVIEERERLSLLTVGRLSPERGLETLFEAMIQLPAELRQRIELQVVGDGADMHRLRGLVIQKGLSDQVHFHGFVAYGERLQRLYNETDLFVLPSYTEGFPKVLLEAFSNQAPIVCTDVGSISHVLQSGRDSLIVPPRDAQALAQAIARALTEPGLRQSMIESGTETVRGVTVEKMSEIFITNVKPEKRQATAN